MYRLRPTPARLRSNRHQNWHKTVLKPKFCISSLLAESAGVMKSKLFPQCQQRIHPVFYILLFFNRMILNSGRHTREDRLWESKFYIPFQPQKWASNKSNSSVHDIILRILRFLADFFSVQRLLAFARSFHTFSCMLHRTGKLTN